METVGIYLTTFNRADYLESTIKSILVQTYKDFNLYILDNRSTDHTREVVEEFADKRIKYILNERNLGMVGNWNRALEISKEPYTIIFHDDDLMMENYLEEIVGFFSNSPDIVFIHTGAYIIDSNNKFISTLSGNWDRMITGETFFKKYLKKGGIILAPTVTINKTKLPVNERFDLALPFTADVNFWLRISRYGNIGFIDKPLIKYRRHDLSITNSLYSNLDNKIKDRLHYKQSLEKEIKDRGMYEDEFRKTPQNYFTGALSADILHIKLQTRSYLKVFKAVVKIAKINPKIFLYLRFYVYFFITLIPSSVIELIRKIKNQAKNKKVLSNIESRPTH